MLVVAGKWPLGNKVLVGEDTGATAGTVAGVSSTSGGAERTDGCGPISLRIRAELTQWRVMARSKRWMMVSESREGEVAIRVV